MCIYMFVCIVVCITDEHTMMVMQACTGVYIVYYHNIIMICDDVLTER